MEMFASPISASCSPATCLAILALALAALRSSVRVVFAVADAALERARCLRWGVIASLTAVLVLAFAPPSCLGPVTSIALCVAALDCWLALLAGRVPTLPRAIARLRSTRTVRSR